MCPFLPLCHIAVCVIVPIVAICCRLGFAKVVTSGVGEVVVIANADTRPFVCRAFVVHLFKARTIFERIATNVRHAVGNGDACKTRATRERPVTNARHAVRDSDTLKALAITERAASYARHTVGDGNACKTRATGERPVANARHTVGDSDSRKACATVEGMVTNLRNRIGNCNLGDKFVVKI